MKETHVTESGKYIVFFLYSLHLTICGSIQVPSDTIFLDCGSSGESSFNGERWIGDIGSSFLLPSYNKISSSLFVLNQDNNRVPKIPYSTTRIIHSPLNYTFSFTTPSLKFIRIYFLSTSYLNMNPSKAYFSVKVGRYTLLSGFSPFVAAQELNLAYFTKDFLVNVVEEKLNITIIPSSLVSNAFAFINGIEIFSVPSTLYFPFSKLHVPYLGHQELNVSDQHALEMLYRVSIKEVDNVFGAWAEDSGYLSGSLQGNVLDGRIRRPFSITYNTSTSFDSNFSAPEELYLIARTMGSNQDANMKYNLTWSFPVDSGFRYLVRLHFCEISMEVTKANQRVFKVYINNQTAEESMDIVALVGAPFVAFYKDYVVMVPWESERRLNMSIALHPNMESKPTFADAILSGIEIIKLSDNNFNLAVSSPLIEEQQKKKKAPLMIVLLPCTSALAFGLLTAIFVFIHQSWKKQKRENFQVLPLNATRENDKDMQVKITSGQCCQFTLEEISIATNNFNEDLVIGEGGFGKVYKGIIVNDGVTSFAIKRCKPGSRQGLKEFQNEIKFFTFCHLNLVSLIGFCQEDNELILVYEYMANGSLCDHLYKKQNQPLTWHQRLNICVGAARGLHYLHTGTRQPIIHRDIKSSNILLDQNLVPKIADFGLSRTIPSPSHTHISTQVKGTLGYLDPEYYKRRKLTEKSDVYSFGVVLFEVLSARPAVNHVAEEDYTEKVGLAEWALHCHQCRSIEQLVDPQLEGKISSECLVAFVEIGIQCLKHRSVERPTMGDVLSKLEEILSLQESFDEQELNSIQITQRISDDIEQLNTCR
ncbi:hypothetical protein PIB30_068784 [Stylosanthes scabra]|uniref:Protein kinase domain-containing protein n=1 Tax=Stylosanthes scabra TaxID=79078 RepID=A0ABU6SN35_9FABA|nr:hypothetical protein [Stylosanthes scabra]